MRSKETTELFSYWASKRIRGGVPIRSSINPGDLARILPRVFMLSIKDARAVFRLAGSELYTLYGRELTRSYFQEIWDAGSLKPLQEKVIESAETQLALEVRSIASSSMGSVTIDTLLLPISSSPDFTEIDQFIGIQSWGSHTHWIGEHTISTSRMMAAKIVSRNEEPGAPVDVPVFTPTAMATARYRGHLKVIEGDRA
jgi:hypothetical protein